MPRERRGSGDEEDDLNLVPFMNMVVILIPLLLLSVVFLKVGVINITSPELSVPPKNTKPPPEDEEKPLNLTVAVSDKGFQVGATGGILPPEQGCSKNGPTICLADDSVDVQSQVEQARKEYAKGTKAAKKRGHKVLQKAAAAYDWVGLYNMLMEIKKKYEEKDEKVVKISANPDMPYSFIVRVMDVARYKLKEESYDSKKKFWNAKPETKVEGDKKVPVALFNQPILSIAK